jgi:hypothetical protein
VLSRYAGFEVDRADGHRPEPAIAGVVGEIIGAVGNSGEDAAARLADLGAPEVRQFGKVVSADSISASTL